MAKNKYDFIKDLLADKKVNQNQREKILELASREIGFEETLEWRVQKIEEIIYGGRGENLQSNSNLEAIHSLKDIEITVKDKNITKSTTKLVSEKRHDPKKVTQWLKLFTLDESTLKYSTHSWDDTSLFSKYQDFVERLNEAFVKYNFRDLERYNYDLYWKIYPFLFQKKLTEIQRNGKKAFEWGQHRIKIGWQYPDEIKNWCAVNYDEKGKSAKQPLTMELPEELRPTQTINGKTIILLEEVVDLFKKEIEFRDNDLYFAVKTLIRKELPNYQIDSIELESLKGCNFYTNTGYIIKAITRIFWMIKSRSESTRIKFFCNYDKTSSVYEIQIAHLNSFSDKEISHPKLMLKEDSGDLSSLRKTLQSLCDFSVTSRFKDNTDSIIARIEYLYDGVEKNGWEPRITRINDPVDGFYFNLKFLTS